MYDLVINARGILALWNIIHGAKDIIQVGDKIYTKHIGQRELFGKRLG